MSLAPSASWWLRDRRGPPRSASGWGAGRRLLYGKGLNTKEGQKGTTLCNPLAPKPQISSGGLCPQPSLNATVTCVTLLGPCPCQPRGGTIRQGAGYDLPTGGRKTRLAPLQQIKATERLLGRELRRFPEVAAGA